MPFDHNNIVHQQLTSTLYSTMIPSDTDGIKPDITQKKPMLSKKWEKIGFLGPDLSTEFRGVGIFGALMLFYLASKHPKVMEQLYQLSLNPAKVIVSIDLLIILGISSCCCCTTLFKHYHRNHKGRPFK
jgi:hypothetical protein